MRVILICPDATLRRTFQNEIDEHTNIALCGVLSSYPSADELSRLVQSWTPDVAIVSMADPAAAEATSLQLEREFPLVQRVGIHASQDPATLRLALWFRMCEFIAPPFHTGDLKRMFERLSRHPQLQSSARQSRNPLFAFVPAKGGVGASTIAANTTWALSRSAESSVLHADFDTFSGMAGFLFNTDHDYSLTDAVQRSGDLDDDTWQRLVQKVGKIQLLLSGAPLTDETFSRERISNILAYARRHYAVVNADLPDSFGEVSLAVLEQATRIFLVVTPEPLALRLARLKRTAFRKLGLDGRLSLLVNRLSKNSAFSADQIEEIVEMPVYASFPSHYENVATAILTGQPASRLVPSIQSFAQKALKGNDPERRPRFLERFALSPIGEATGS